MRSRSANDWKEVADGLIRISPAEDREAMRRTLAQDWIAAGVWLREASDLFKAALKEPAPPNDGSLRGQIDAAHHATSRWVAFENLAQAGLQLKDLDQARTAIQEQRRWLDEDFREHFVADPRAWPDNEGRHLRLSAELAEAEKHKLDALSYYRPILASPYYAQEYGTSKIIERAHPIWTDLGGTDPAWNIWSRQDGLLVGFSLLPRGVPLRPWVKVRQPLPDVKLVDANDRSWTVADFAGKTSFVYVWATWCGPCWRDLPLIQKLHESVRGRPDVQVVTLAEDDGPATVLKFLTERHFDFPALVSRTYVRNLLGDHVMGQVWLIDREGAIRAVSVTTPRLPPDTWVREALETLSRPLK
jgi:thiol-disulfide isomerase/thioredoxin